MCHVHYKIDNNTVKGILTRAEFDAIKPCTTPVKERLDIVGNCKKGCYLNPEYEKKYIMCSIAYTKYVVLRDQGNTYHPSGDGDFQFLTGPKREHASSFSREN